MKGRIVFLSAVTLATSTMALRADLPGPTCVAPRQSPDVRKGAPERAAEPQSNRWDGLAGGLACSSPRPLVLDAPPQRRGPEARGFPAGPGSFSLVLTAFGSLGAWRLGRSTKKFHFSSVPDWYHTGGPTQIGHAIVLDLQSQPQALCPHDTVAGGPVPAHRLRNDVPLHCTSQFHPTLTAPRGPPVGRS